SQVVFLSRALRHVTNGRILHSAFAISNIQAKQAKRSAIIVVDFGIGPAIDALISHTTSNSPSPKPRRPLDRLPSTFTANPSKDAGLTGIRVLQVENRFNKICFLETQGSISLDGTADNREKASDTTQVPERRNVQSR